MNFWYIWDLKVAKIYYNQNSEPLKLPEMTFADCLNSQKFDFTQNWSGGKIIQFQQIQATTSHFESFWSIVQCNLSFSSFFAGAFVIPFLIMMLLEGMPLLLLELGIGQKMRTGSLGVWNRVHPYLGGIGLGSTVIAVVVGCYYNMIIAWCLFYLYYSMRVSFFFE